LSSQEVERRIIDYEYQDILEERNGIMVAEATIPIGLLAVFFQLQFITGDLIKLVASAIVVGCSWFGLELQRRKLSSDLRAKREQLRTL
jgi:hypothetical protein